MTQEEEDQGHEELRRLFDDTAEQASGPTLTKLAARAADIPSTARRSGFLPRWAWGPLFAAAAATLGGLLTLRGATRTPARSGPELGSAAPAVSRAVAMTSTRELNAASPRPTVAEEPADNLELLGDADEGARFEVSGPQSDRDLDAWLAATKELSGGS